MRTPPPELPHPDEVRAALSSAQARATDEVLELRRKQRKWILIGVGAYIITLVGLAVAVFLLYQQGGKIVALQNAQADSAKTGRGILTNLAEIADQIKSQTDPNSQASKDQQTKVAEILGQLDEAQRQGRADQLKKIAQMFEQCRALPCDPAVVNRILAQPVPVPTFGAGPPPVPTPSPAMAKPASTAGASVGKSSSAAAVPKPCPGPVVIQATPLMLPLLPPTDVNVCVPALPKP